MSCSSRSFNFTIYVILILIQTVACKSRGERTPPSSNVLVAGKASSSEEFPFAVGLTFATRMTAEGKSELVSEPEKSCVINETEGSSLEPKTSYRWDHKLCTRHVYCSGSIYLGPDGKGPVKLATAAHCLNPNLGAQNIRLSIGSDAERFLAVYPNNLKAHPDDKPEPVRERFLNDVAKSTLSGSNFPSYVKPIRLIDPDRVLPMPDTSDRLLAEMMIWIESQDISKTGRNPQSSLKRLSAVLPAVYAAAYGVSREGLEEAVRDEGRLRSMKGMILMTADFNQSSKLRVLPAVAENGICSGDSGGSIVLQDFVADTQPAEFRLIGIIASGLRDECRGTLAHAANVMRHSAWLTAD